MFLAPISLKSLSASYFKSFETLNLKRYTFEKVNKQGKIQVMGVLTEQEAYLPKWSLPAQKVILINDPCNSPAFPHTGSITNQIASTFPSRQKSFMLLWYKSIVYITFHHTQKHISFNFPSFKFLQIGLFIHFCDVTWAAYVIASSCRADRQPRSMVSSGMDTLYQTSGGLTLDRELVSTTGSGCRRPTFTAWTNTFHYVQVKEVAGCQDGSDTAAIPFLKIIL